MPPKFGRRESRPEIQAYRAREAAKQESAPRHESESAEEAVLNEWRERIKELEKDGVFESSGRWASIPKGWTREQMKFAEDLRAQDRARAAEAAEPAATNEAPNAETTEEVESGLEIGQTYMLEVDGVSEAFTYGGQKDGKAIMLTPKGERLMRSQGLDKVLAMAEVYENDFARLVDPAEVKAAEQAA